MYSSQSFDQMNSERKKCSSYGIQMMLRMSNLFNQMSDLCKNAILEFSKDFALNQDLEKFTKYRFSDERQQKLTVLKKTTAPTQSRQRSAFERVRGRKVPNRPSLPRSSRKRQKNPTIKISVPQEAIVQEPKAQQKAKRSQRPGRRSRRPVSIIEQQNQHQVKSKAEVGQKTQKRQSSLPKKNENKSQVLHKQQQKSFAEPIPVSSRIPRPKIKQSILLESSELKQPLGKRVSRVNNQPNIVLSISDQQLSSQPSDYKARRAYGRRGPSSNRNKRGGSRRKSKKSQLKQGESGQKRPINGFMRFFQQVKDEIKKNNNIKKLPDLSYLISVQWKKLSKKEQEKYNDAYYSDLKNFKVDDNDIKKAKKRSYSRRNNKKDTLVQEVKDSNQYEVEQAIKDESVSQKGQGDGQDQASGNQSVSVQERQERQEEDEGESSAQMGKPRKILRVKRPSPKKKESEDERQKEGEQASGSEEFSVSGENEGSSSGQENSESSSDGVSQAKESKSISKSQNQGKSSGSGKKKE